MSGAIASFSCECHRFPAILISSRPSFHQYERLSVPVFSVELVLPPYLFKVKYLLFTLIFTIIAN